MNKVKFILFAAITFGLLSFCGCRKSGTALPPPNNSQNVEEKQESGDPDGLKLMSFNVRYKNDDDTGDKNWSMRCPAICDMLNAQKPLLMGVQECLKVQRDDILGVCKDYGAIGVGRDDGKNSGEMMAIFYRKADVTIEQWGTFWLSKTPDVPSKDWNSACKRCATWARILINSTGKEIFYVNTHLDHKNGRPEQMAVLEEKIAELNTRHLPMFLSADFNVEQNNSLFDNVQTYMYNVRKMAPVTDTRNSYNAWGSAGSAKIIDIIFYSMTGIKALKYETVTNRYGGLWYISDHYPIYGVFELL